MLIAGPFLKLPCFCCSSECLHVQPSDVSTKSRPSRRILFNQGQWSFFRFLFVESEAETVGMKVDAESEATDGIAAFTSCCFHISTVASEILLYEDV